MKGNLLFDEIIRLGYKCNEKCLFCNFTPINEPGYKEKNFEDVKNEIDILIQKYGTAKKISLFFSWWEPFLWGENLFKMIEYAKEQKIAKIWIQTNATLISPKIAERLKKLKIDNLLISLHSHKDSINDAITVHKRSFSLAFAWIKNLQAAGVKFLLNHVLNKINYTDFPEFLEFLNIHNIRELSLAIVQPHGYAEENFEKIVVDYDSLRPYLENGFKVARQKKINLFMHYCDIPLCKFPLKITDDLNFKSLYDIRVKGIRNYEWFVSDLSGSKIKTPDCVRCKYNNYCYGVWRKYILWFWLDSISPQKKYKSLLELQYDSNDYTEKKLEIDSENICFFHEYSKNTISSISKSLKKKYLVIQYVFLWDQFMGCEATFLIDIIVTGVNVINIDLDSSNLLDVKKLLLNLQEVFNFSEKNTPHYNVVFFIKTKKKSVKQLLSLKFKDRIIFV